MDNVQIITTIRELVKKASPSYDISDILYQHDCLYLLEKSNSALSVDLKSLMTLNLIMINQRYKTCENVFKQLDNVNYAVIKGAVLSNMEYGNPCYRRSGDIDILIARNDIDFVKRCFLENGFVQGRVSGNEIIPFSRSELLYQTALSHQTAPFIMKTTNQLCPFVNVDINLDVMWGESKRKIDVDSFLKGNIEYSVINGVLFKKLKQINEFISLCLHHYKDMNSIYLLSKGSLKLSLFCDIYYYLKNNRIDSFELAAKCDEFKISKYVYYCIYYTNVIFEDDFLSEYIELLYNEECDEIIRAYGLTEEEYKFWKKDFPTRLFDPQFQKNFISYLTQDDIQKIQINTQYM